MNVRRPSLRKRRTDSGSSRLPVFSVQQASELLVQHFLGGQELVETGHFPQALRAMFGVLFRPRLHLHGLPNSHGHALNFPGDAYPGAHVNGTQRRLIVEPARLDGLQTPNSHANRLATASRFQHECWVVGSGPEVW